MYKYSLTILLLAVSFNGNASEKETNKNFTEITNTSTIVRCTHPIVRYTSGSCPKAWRVKKTIITTIRTYNKGEV